jgi:hypothetical protein
MGSWLRGPLLGFFDAKVNEQAVRDCGILNWPAIKALRDAHVSGRHKHSKALFAALMLTGWCESYSS